MTTSDGMNSGGGEEVEAEAEVEKEGVTRMVDGKGDEGGKSV